MKLMIFPPNSPTTMTEQEADAFAARLTRIWSTVTPIIQWDSNSYGGFIMFSIMLDVRAIHSGWLFKMSRDAMRSNYDFEIEAWPDGAINMDNHPMCKLYLPLFRRGCWLSGANIEASAHEKMDWIQGFTQEELESWNLTF